MKLFADIYIFICIYISYSWTNVWTKLTFFEGTQPLGVARDKKYFINNLFLFMPFVTILGTDDTNILIYNYSCLVFIFYFLQGE